jgi:hypothetical protein
VKTALFQLSSIVSCAPGIRDLINATPTYTPDGIDVERLRHTEGYEGRDIHNFLPQRLAGIATIVGGESLFLSEGISLNSRSSLVSSAEARVGRPLTPMSYAGVARRTTRRAVAYRTATGVTGGQPRMRRPVVCRHRSRLHTDESSPYVGEVRPVACRPGRRRLRPGLGGP